MKRPKGTVIPGWSAGPDPESRDSGFDASHRPGMTAKKPSGRDRPDRLWLRLLPGPAQFSHDFGVQHLFQPVKGPGDQGGVGNAVIPANHDIDGLVLLYDAITEDKRAGAERVKLASPISGDRGHHEAAEKVGALATEIEPDQPGEA